MQVDTPQLRTSSTQACLTTRLKSATGLELPPLEIVVGIEHVDLLDPTGTPLAAASATIGAALGESVSLEAPTDNRALAGAQTIADWYCRWWDRPAITIDATETYNATPNGDNVGLLFTRGVDSWATLLERQSNPTAPDVTHLLRAILTYPEADLVHSRVLREGHQRVADELGLEQVLVETNIRRILDPYQPWIAVFSPALVQAMLSIGGTFDEIILASSTFDCQETENAGDARITNNLSTGSVKLTHGLEDISRLDKVRRVLTSPLARSSLQVCWVEPTPRNCGRCRKCQMTMSLLLLAGDPCPEQGFDHPLEPELIYEFAALPDIVESLQELVAGLEPAHEDLRRAWCYLLRTQEPGPVPGKLGVHSASPTTGASAVERVASTLRAIGRHPDDAPNLSFGFGNQALKLRPALDAQPAIWATVTDDTPRPCKWAVIEPHSIAGSIDPYQGRLAGRLTELFGAGIVYVSGVGWPPESPPVLPKSIVSSMLRSAQVRFWWRGDGDLDPMRVIESIEQGCVPLQVMADQTAAELRDSLESPYRSCIVAESELEDLDLNLRLGLLEPLAAALMTHSAESTMEQATA